VKRKISIIGAPVWLGQPHYGTQFGPDALRSVGLIDALRTINGDVLDIGNATPKQLPPASEAKAHNLKNLEAVRASVELLSEKVSQIVSAGRFPLVLGGDHSLALGSLAGIAKHYKNLGVIWYDAHADINTPETSPSGNIHGMPLAASLGLGHKSLTQLSGYAPKVNPENLVLIGIRDLDPGEISLIKEKKIKFFTSEDVLRLGVNAVIKETLSYLAPRCDGIHLSFDLDVINPQEIAGVGTPAVGGVDLASTMEAMHLLFRSSKITSADFVEVNPLLDQDGQTTTAALTLIQALINGASANETTFSETIAV